MYYHSIEAPRLRFPNGGVVIDPIFEQHQLDNFGFLIQQDIPLSSVDLEQMIESTDGHQLETSDFVL